MAKPSILGAGTTAFVTGASTGLGRAFAERLLAEGVRVWGTAREIGRLEELRRHSGFTAVVLDLHDRAQAVEAFTEASHQAGGFDLVINNAGYGVFGSVASTAPDLWSQQIDAMLQTTLALARLALGEMNRRGHGCLVNVSSLAAEFPIPYMSGYNVCKAGLSAWSESVLYELTNPDVVVIDFRPGDFRTPFNNAVRRTDDSADLRAHQVWQRLEETLAAAPLPTMAADDLCRAMRRRRSGVVRTGSFFQARLSPLFARFVPVSWRRAAQAGYFKLS